MLGPISRLLEFLVESEPTDEPNITNTLDSLPRISGQLTSPAYASARDQLRTDQANGHSSFADGPFSGKRHHFPDWSSWKGTPAEQRFTTARLTYGCAWVSRWLGACSALSPDFAKVRARQAFSLAHFSVGA